MVFNSIDNYLGIVGFQLIIRIVCLIVIIIAFGRSEAIPILVAG